MSNNLPNGLTKNDINHIEGYEVNNCSENYEKEYDKIDYEQEQQDQYELAESEQDTEYVMGWFREGN